MMDATNADHSRNLHRSCEGARSCMSRSMPKSMTRRNWSVGYVLLSAVLAVGQYLRFSEGAVLGIDLGTEFFTVAMVAPGRPFEIVLNPQSKRKTPAAVSFADTTRAFGEDAIAQANRGGDKVFQFIPSLLGINTSGVNSIEDFVIPFPPQQFYPFRYELDQERSTIRIRINDELSVSPEEVLAQIFSFILHMLEESGSEATHCVLTVPVNFGIRQRQSMRDAAEIAGLRVSALVHANAAAALQHALDIDFEVNDAKRSGELNSTDTAGDSTTAQEGKDTEGATSESLKTSDKGNNTTTTTTSTRSASSKTPQPIPPRFQLFYNLGSYNTQACVVKYWGDLNKKSVLPVIQTLGCASTSGEISGHTADLALADRMLSEFVKEQGDSLGLSSISDLPGRVFRKIVKEAKRTKSILSTNKEASFYVESLYKDRDFKRTISRSSFEGWWANSIAEKFGQTKDKEPYQVLLQEIRKPVDQALQIANITSLADVASIELVGGAWRIPLVQTALQEMIKSTPNAPNLKLGQRVNADEAMALGAAFMAANHSTAFRVRVMNFTDVSDHLYKVDIKPLDVEDPEHAPSVTDDGELMPSDSGHTLTLIDIGDRLSGNRTLNFRANRDLSVKLYEDETLMTIYEVRGLRELHEKRKNALKKVQIEYAAQGGGDEGEAEAKDSSTTADESLTIAKLGLHFGVGPMGIVTLGNAVATMKDINLSVVEPPKKTTTTTTTKTPAPDTETGEKAAESKQETSDDNSSKSQSGEKATEENEEKDNRRKLVKKKVLSTKSLKLIAKEQGLPLPLSKEEKAKAIERLKQFDATDREVRKRENARNSLESYIYASRNRLTTDSVQKISEAEEREKLSLELGTIEEWLYDDGFSAPRTEFEAKHHDLSNLLEPVFMRAYELENRKRAIDTWHSTIEIAQSTLRNMTDSMTWLPKNDTEEVSNFIEEHNNWFTAKLAKQNSLPLTESPAFTFAELKLRINEIVGKLTKLSKIKQPKPEPTIPPTARPNATEPATEISQAEGDTADPQGDTADTQGDTADTQGDTADTQGDTADTQGDTADTQGDTADTKQTSDRHSKSEEL